MHYSPRRAPNLLFLAFLAFVAVTAGARGDSPPPRPGPAPQLRAAGYDPVEDNHACEGCHATIAAEWRGSLHHRSWDDPVFLAAYALEPIPFCRGCHVPEADPTHLPPEGARRLGVGCVTCHVQAGQIVGARAVAESGGAHAVVAAARTSSSAACDGCHQVAFPKPQRAPMQGTADEHRASPHAGEACQSCHMPLLRDGLGRPYRSHDFRVLGDAARLRSALTASASRAGDHTVTVSVAAAFIATHKARFQQLFRIDGQGVRVAKRDGTLAPIEGAQSTFKPGPEYTTVEITLPTKALPRLSEAPLTALNLLARAATTPKPPAFEKAQWEWLILKDPVGFEPWAELRAYAFDMIRPPDPEMEAKSSLSYQLGDPRHIELILYDRGEYDASHVAPSETTLYTPQATLGDIEVGHVSVRPGVIAILKKGKPLTLVDLPGKLMGVVARDGELHALSYDHYTYPEDALVSAKWSAVTVAADGSYQEEVVDQEEAHLSWGDVAEFHSKRFDSFGLRGWTDFTESGKPEGVVLTWHWDSDSKTYVAKRERFAVHGKPSRTP